MILPIEELQLSPVAWAKRCRGGDDYSYDARGMAPIMEDELELLIDICGARGLELFADSKGLRVERL